MPQVRIFFTRLRKEEKLLAEAAEREGIPCSLEDAREMHSATTSLSDDVILCRCISHSQNVAWRTLRMGQGRKSGVCYGKVVINWPPAWL